MNYAVIFAGGVGTRMNSKAIPKQFLEINGKPVLIHTIEHFENHPKIDAICVVCVKEWLEHLKKLLCKFHIQKVNWVVPGGATAMESQFNGLKAIQAATKSIVLIHDGVRPLINEQVITDCIDSVEKYGSAVITAPATETIVRKDEAGCIISTVTRSECMLARAPQCFYLDEIIAAFENAMAQDNSSFIDSATLMLYSGHQLHAVLGPSENIKVTTPADFYICRALLNAREDSQIYGI